MNSFIRQATVLALIANLLVATMGLTVHSLYCLCKGEQVISLFEIDDNCDKKTTTENLGCCAGVDACTEAQSLYSDTHRDCSQKNQQFVKIESKYLASVQKDVQQLIAPPIKTLYSPVEQSLITETVSRKNNKAPPPKYAGRSYFLVFESFLC